jgi:ATP-dependent RNA helicase RhlB
VHRIGRTARFGATGEAISFICEEYAYSMPDIEEYIAQKVPVAVINPAWLLEVIKPVKRATLAYKERPLAGRRTYTKR